MAASLFSLSAKIMTPFYCVMWPCDRQRHLFLFYFYFLLTTGHKTCNSGFSQHNDVHCARDMPSILTPFHQLRTFGFISQSPMSILSGGREGCKPCKGRGWGVREWQWGGSAITSGLTACQGSSLHNGGRKHGGCKGC